MRAYASCLTLILGSLSLAQAIANGRRQEGVVSPPNLADGFRSICNYVNAQQTVTETIRQTITVGAAGAVEAVTNATSGAVTVTVTAAGSTVTVCPGQVLGVVESAQGPRSASASAAPAEGPAVFPVAAASGGVGVSIVSVPAEARKTSAVGNQPAASQPAASSANADGASPLTPLPPQSSGADAPPGLSSTSSAASDPIAGAPSSVTSAAASNSTLGPPPGLASTSSEASVPIAGAPASLTSAAAPNSTLVRRPGVASSLSSTLDLAGTSTVGRPTAIADSGAFGGVVGMIPMSSAAVPVPTTPAVANGAVNTAVPQLDVSGLTLASKINLGNLGARPTVAAAA
ncbi:hypothetical protein BT67DRAFT_186690 [Trichocladium antarcticum]|uniref:Uncharacterized protein n=1 Tax=Trichocladium antarcticum TaxID=1450529 RepID=A0AAN6UPG9_9PEZI|nr:hypothetical protein BT67DRAFT_186690 [Trichocladium antarcticum]